jgi:hypothetical protein
MTPLQRDQSTALPSQAGQFWLWLFMLALILSLGACATTEQERTVHSDWPAAYPERTLPPTRVYFYPAAGQNVEQQDRDRYECHIWAVKQSGFDPSMPMPAPSPRVEVISSPPPGHDTAVGAVTGALLGAAVSHPRDAGEGAVVGAVAGAVIGAASDASRQERAGIIQRRYDQRDAQRTARLERQAQGYRRAMSACLEGRGYTVQ